VPPRALGVCALVNGGMVPARLVGWMAGRSVGWLVCLGKEREMCVDGVVSAALERCCPSSRIGLLK
jgi:hypothetical protein